MPPDVVAPAPLSLLSIVMVRVVVVGTLVIINFLSQKSEDPKLEPVIAVNVEGSPNNIMSPT